MQKYYNYKIKIFFTFSVCFSKGTVYAVDNKLLENLILH